jgi:hypothetical protein
MNLVSEQETIQSEDELISKQLVETKTIDISNAEMVVNGIRKAFPNLKFGHASEDNCIIATAKMCPSSGFTLYRNGKMVLTGALVGFLE